MRKDRLGEAQTVYQRYLAGMMSKFVEEEGVE